MERARGPEAERAQDAGTMATTDQLIPHFRIGHNDV